MQHGHHPRTKELKVESWLLCLLLADNTGMHAANECSLLLGPFSPISPAPYSCDCQKQGDCAAYCSQPQPYRAVQCGEQSPARSTPAAECVDTGRGQMNKKRRRKMEAAVPLRCCPFVGLTTSCTMKHMVAVDHQSSPQEKSRESTEHGLLGSVICRCDIQESWQRIMHYSAARLTARYWNHEQGWFCLIPG